MHWNCSSAGWPLHAYLGPSGMRVVCWLLEVNSFHNDRQGTTACPYTLLPPLETVSVLTLVGRKRIDYVHVILNYICPHYLPALGPDHFLLLFLMDWPDCFRVLDWFLCIHVPSLGRTVDLVIGGRTCQFNFDFLSFHLLLVNKVEIFTTGGQHDITWHDFSDFFVSAILLTHKKLIVDRQLCNICFYSILIRTSS